MKTLKKYSDAVRGMLMLRRLLKSRRAELDVAASKRDVYNIVSDEMNKVFEDYAVYDETYWIVWMAAGSVEIPLLRPVNGVGYEVVGWTKPRMFRKASAW